MDTFKCPLQEAFQLYLAKRRKNQFAAGRPAKRSALDLGRPAQKYPMFTGSKLEQDLNLMQTHVF